MYELMWVSEGALFEALVYIVYTQGGHSRIVENYVRTNIGSNLKLQATNYMNVCL